MAIKFAAILATISMTATGALPGLASPKRCTFHNPYIRPMEQSFQCLINRTPEGVVKSITELDSNGLYTLGRDGWSWGGEGGRFGKWFIQNNAGMKIYFD